MIDQLTQSDIGLMIFALPTSLMFAAVISIHTNSLGCGILFFLVMTAIVCAMILTV